MNQSIYGVTKEARAIIKEKGYPGYIYTPIGSKLGEGILTGVFIVVILGCFYELFTRL